MFKNILQFLQKLLKLGQTNTTALGKAQPQVQTAPKATEVEQDEYSEGRIRYSEQLIPNLTQDHVELVNLYGSFQQLIQHRHYSQIAQALEQLKSKFNLHIMQENLHFYCYLEQSFRTEPEQLEMIKAYRKEMNHISSAVVRFIKKWQIQEINDLNVTAFIEEYQAVGEVLAQRIHQEEHHLYTLYQPA